MHYLYRYNIVVLKKMTIFYFFMILYCTTNNKNIYKYDNFYIILLFNTIYIILTCEIIDLKSIDCEHNLY